MAALHRQLAEAGGEVRFEGELGHVASAGGADGRIASFVAEGHVEDHRLVRGVLVMAVAVPIGGVDVQLHVALEDRLVGQANDGVAEVGPRLEVPPARREHPQLAAVLRAQFIGGEVLIEPEASDEPLAHGQSGRLRIGGLRLADVRAFAKLQVLR